MESVVDIVVASLWGMLLWAIGYGPVAFLAKKQIQSFLLAGVSLASLLGGVYLLYTKSLLDGNVFLLIPLGAITALLLFPQLVMDQVWKKEDEFERRITLLANRLSEVEAQLRREKEI